MVNQKSFIKAVVDNPTINKAYNWLNKKSFFKDVRSFYRDARAYRILGRIKQSPPPNHIAIIMDGNRRWAKKMGLDVTQGHLAGRDTLEQLIDWWDDVGSKVLTVYAFSAENLKRSDKEINFLMSKMAEELNRWVEEPRVHKTRTRVRVIGDLGLLPEDVGQASKRIMERTKDYSDHFFNLAIGYGGRQEIIKAIKSIAKEVKDGKVDLTEIDEKKFSTYLYTKGLPDPDLIIRTSGEERISNFLLWQAAYSELYFTDVYWPEFTKRTFMKAVEDYQLRQRRYGT
jgi:tritrans,polycis-undecaprenyl-diphosphate synthase [geranylgeranyl-diphosphate specific]